MNTLASPVAGHIDLNRLADILAVIPRGMIMEFGVAEGTTLRAIAELVQERTVYGFDSFEGLPEDWLNDKGRVMVPRGAFACDVPEVPSNVELVIGYFQNTLPQFLAAHRRSVAFVHIDCDLYSSTKFVLNALKDRLHDAIVVFDEFRGLPEYDHNEGRAWREFVDESGYVVEEMYDLRLWPRGATFHVV